MLTRYSLRSFFRSSIPLLPTRALTTAVAAHHSVQTQPARPQDEDDWSTEVPSGLPLDGLIEQSRFNWRDRATSRPRPVSSASSVAKELDAPAKRVSVGRSELHLGEPFHSEVATYAGRFLPLLAAEEHDVEKEVKDRLANWPIKRLQQEGYCLTNMSAYWMEATKSGRPAAVFQLGAGTTLPSTHRFDTGVTVLVSRVDPLEESAMQGTLLSSNSTTLTLSFDEHFDASDGYWRLDVGLSNLAFKRMREAIQALNQDPVHQEEISSETHQMILQGTHLRDVLLRSFSDQPEQHHNHVALQDPDDVAYGSEALEHDARTPGERAGAFKSNMLIQSWAKRHVLHPPLRVEGDPILEDMNTSQVRAMATMIGERFSLIQGPPGTGKTRTIIETIKLLKAHFEVPQPILVATYTNVAVDNLVEGFVKAGLKPLRVGFPAMIRASLEPYTVDYQSERHPLAPKAKATRKEADDLKSQLEEDDKSMEKLERDHTPSAAKKKLKLDKIINTRKRRFIAVKSKLAALEKAIMRDILNAADVICTTCLTSANSKLAVVDFPVVFLDEASMSTEPASLVPLMKGSEHVALIGDHKQLPPVITSSEAQTNGLGISLFERLTEEGDVPSVMLNIQYRMHPAISRFPAAEFYNNLLLDGMVDAAGGIPSRLNPPASTQLDAHAPKAGSRPSVIFIDHTGNESFKGRSRVNWNEAHIVCSIIEDLLLQNEHLSGADIGVIAPYAAQISLLTRLLTTDSGYQERFRAVLGRGRAEQLPRIEVKTVDGFEGREKEVILFSTVRNNPDGHIGFLADRRRLNVGLTRAKRGLFVVGSLSTLRAGKVSGAEALGNVRVGKGGEAWQRYAQFLTQERLVVQLSGQRLAEALYGNLPAKFRDAYLGAASRSRW